MQLALATLAQVEARFNLGAALTDVLDSGTAKTLSLTGRLMPCRAFVSMDSSNTVTVETFVTGPGWRTVATLTASGSVDIFTRPGESAPTQVRFQRTVGSAVNTIVGISGNSLGGVSYVGVATGNVDGGSFTSNETGTVPVDGGTF